MQQYTIIFQKEGKFYVATCVELGVVSQGKTLEESRENIKEAIELYLTDSPNEYCHRHDAPLVSTVRVKV